ncbi:MAG: hypothetical protein HDKAJFGB_02686 [Anaerolineae bacterium]|nr:hypothetical protein [Anaerolineae bacterium]
MFHNKPRRTAGRVRQKSVQLRDAAVGNPLFAPREFVTCHVTVFRDRHGFARKRSQIAARLRFSCAVCDEQRLVRDFAHPIFFLFRRRADRNRVGAEKRRQNAGGDAQINGRHQFRHAINIVRAAAETAVLFGNKNEMQTEMLWIVQFLENLGRELVVVVELNEIFGRQFIVRVFFERIENHLARFMIKTGHGVPP